MNNPLVSVIVPCKNSALTIEKCLQSIRNQSYNEIELILVDNYSTDQTFNIWERYATVIATKGPERTAQKNYWISIAKWEFVFFVDSDMELTKDVVCECIDIYKMQDNVGWVCIPEDSVWEWFFVQVRDYERSFYEWTGIESARFFRKADVENVWWFEEDLVFYEESLLPQKVENFLGKRCNFRIKSIIHHHEGALDIMYWLKKKYYYWSSMGQYKNKVSELWLEHTLNQQTGIVWRYLIFIWNSRFYAKPLLAIWVLILKTMEFASGWLGWLASMLKLPIK